jgi:hypothetical protein
MKIGIVTNDTLTSVDYYRTMGFWPFVTDATLLENPGWWDIPFYDVILVCRPYTIKGLRACQMAKEFGKTLWIDFDDDILTKNDNFVVTEDMIKNTETALPLADLIVCSTEGVEDAYKEFGKTKIRKNYFNDKVFKFDPVFSENNLVAYRGLQRYHRFNLMEYHDVMRMNVPWIRYGTDLCIPGKEMPEMPFPDYMVNLRAKAPAIMFKPLIDVSANRAKSNCAWLEATFAGAVCVAPDWPVWQEDGIITYTDKQCAKEEIEMLLEDVELRRSFFDMSVKNIRENYLLSHFNFIPEKWGL